MTDDTYCGMKIVWDQDLPPITSYVISPAAADAIQEAMAVLGRDLTEAEVMSCLVHRSAKLVLDDATSG